MKAPATVMEEMRGRYGDVWMLRMQKQTTFVLVSDPELIKQVMTADPAVIAAGEANAMIGTALMGKYSMILLDEPEHMTARKLLLPPFHGEHIQRYRELMERFVEEEIASWPLDEPIPLLPRMQNITRHAIMSAVFGVTGGAPWDKLQDRIMAMLEFSEVERNMIIMHVANRLGRLPKSFLRVSEPLNEVIYEEIERSRNDPRLEEREDILAMLIQTTHEDGSPMSNQELRDHLVTLLMQGHMSTATALAWSLERLMRHPQVFEKLRSELQTGSEDYLDAVFKESLRVRPPVGMVMRMVKEPYQLGDYVVEPGMLIAPCIYALHRREDIYPDPLRFHPERFLDQPTGTYTWMPFGGGPRHCIGRSFATLEIKTVLRKLALQARLEPAERADEEVARAGVMFTPNRGALAVLKERVPAVRAADATV